MAISTRSDGAAGAEGRPDYSLEHLPADFEAPGGHAWADFLRLEPLKLLEEDAYPQRQNCWLADAKRPAVLSHLDLGGRAARAIFIEGQFGIVGAGGIARFQDAWLVVWEKCALFVMGDKQFKETYVVKAAYPQMGGEEPAATEDPLVAFFYVLLRQMASPGDVEQQVHAMESAPAPVGARREWTLTNAYLHGYAENLVSRLRRLGGKPIGVAVEERALQGDSVERGVADLVRQMLLLRRFQLFPVEWVDLVDAQRWMGVTEYEAEVALDSMTERGVLEVHSTPRPGESWPNERRRWALSTEQRAAAIEKPPLELPVDAVEEREKRYEMEERIGAVVTACRRFEKQRAPAANGDGPHGAVLRAQGEIQAAEYFRELIGEKLPPPSGDL